jgi:hypothetical protein
MQSKEKNNLIFIRLFPGENLNEEIKKACKNHDVKTAVIISGIGQLKNSKLGYFKKKDDYSPDVFDNPLELLSLSGNICREGDDYNLHIHAILGDEKKNALGGHLIDAQIKVTAEIVLFKTELTIERKLDEKTGLKALFLG